ncbi:MAG: M56 family metallopeptidase [Dorea sp.]|nr:M56 family metallopeptidase [Dorea sp.]
MIWTIKVVFCLLLTSLTGSIVFVFWSLLGEQLEKAGFVNILYILMKLVMLFFIIPIQYPVMSLLDNVYGRYKGDLFLHTQVIMTGCKILLAIWAVGASYILCRQLLMLYRARRMFRASFSCERDVERQFCEVKHRMGIGKNAVGLARCYQTPVAILWGIRKPTVILPVETYTQEELEVIFIHELMHYKHKDILWRRIATALTAVYFFNPFVWKMHKYLRKWSEHACDFEANEIAGGMRHYFNTIMKIQINMRGIQPYCAVTLTENENELVERVRRMKIQNEIKKRSAWKAGVICAVMLSASTVTVFASAEGAGRAYHGMYRATVVSEEVEMPEALPVYEDDGRAEGIIEEVGEVEVLTRNTSQFNWTIENGMQKTGGEFSAKAGEKITLTVDVSPTNRTVRAGIVKPDGKRQYVTGSGTIYNTFSLSQSGTYKIFVENTSGARVTVEGSYFVR